MRKQKEMVERRSSEIESQKTKELKDRIAALEVPHN